MPGMDDVARAKSTRSRRPLVECPAVLSVPVPGAAPGTPPTLHLRTRMLGRGGFATVYELQNTLDGSCIAVKAISKAHLTKAHSAQKLEAEIAIHAGLRHRHIVRFLGHHEDDANVYLLLEHCTGTTVSDVLKRRGSLSERQACKIMEQVLPAVHYLHQRSILHRDLKLSNLFLDGRGRIKLGDFGLACQLARPDERRHTLCGTPNYISPECLAAAQGEGQGPEADIWAIGVMLYALLVGRPPFETPDVRSTYKRIKAVSYAFPEDATLSHEARDLISKILRLEPSERPGLDEVYNHPLFVRHRSSRLVNGGSRALDASLSCSLSMSADTLGLLDLDTLRDSDGHTNDQGQRRLRRQQHTQQHRPDSNRRLQNDAAPTLDQLAAGRSLSSEDEGCTFASGYGSSSGGSGSVAIDAGPHPGLLQEVLGVQEGADQQQRWRALHQAQQQHQQQHDQQHEQQQQDQQHRQQQQQQRQQRQALEEVLEEEEEEQQLYQGQEQLRVQSAPPESRPPYGHLGLGSTAMPPQHPQRVAASPRLQQLQLQTQQPRPKVPPSSCPSPTPPTCLQPQQPTPSRRLNSNSSPSPDMFLPSVHAPVGSSPAHSSGAGSRSSSSAGRAPPSPPQTIPPVARSPSINARAGLLSPTGNSYTRGTVGSAPSTHSTGAAGPLTYPMPGSGGRSGGMLLPLPAFAAGFGATCPDIGPVEALLRSASATPTMQSPMFSMPQRHMPQQQQSQQQQQQRGQQGQPHQSPAPPSRRRPPQRSPSLISRLPFIQGQQQQPQQQHGAVTSAPPHSHSSHSSMGNLPAGRVLSAPPARIAPAPAMAWADCDSSGPAPPASRVLSALQQPVSSCSTYRYWTSPVSPAGARMSPPQVPGPPGNRSSGSGAGSLSSGDLLGVSGEFRASSDQLQPHGNTPEVLSAAPFFKQWLGLTSSGGSGAHPGMAEAAGTAGAAGTGDVFSPKRATAPGKRLSLLIPAGSAKMEHAAAAAAGVAAPADTPAKAAAGHIAADRPSSRGIVGTAGTGAGSSSSASAGSGGVASAAEHKAAVVAIAASAAGTSAAAADEGTGPSALVVRYIDYSSKYGLGYLMDSGVVGVVFNDASRALALPARRLALFIERGKRREDTTDSSSSGSSVGRDADAAAAGSGGEGGVLLPVDLGGSCGELGEPHASVPAALRKKVALLHRFAACLLHDRPWGPRTPPDVCVVNVPAPCPRAVDRRHTAAPPPLAITPTATMPHVRRWVRSRHALLFRMADDSLQVAFSDGSALLLDGSAQQLGFVSPQRRRLRRVTLAEAPGNAAVVRRLKYVRQLLVAQQAGAQQQPHGQKGAGAGAAAAASVGRAAGASGEQERSDTRSAIAA